MQTHYPDSETTSLCSNSLMLIREAANGHLRVFSSIWQRFELTNYHTRGTFNYVIQTNIGLFMVPCFCLIDWFQPYNRNHVKRMGHLHCFTIDKSFQIFLKINCISFKVTDSSDDKRLCGSLGQMSWENWSDSVRAKQLKFIIVNHISQIKSS